MNREEKQLAEAILRYICVGHRISGINFIATPYLIIYESRLPKEEVSISVESEWRIYDEVPASLPVIQFPNDIVDETRTSELIRAISYLAWNKITEIRLGEEIPHLLITFDNGKTLYINGHNDRFESWDFYAGEFQVVATPGDNVAILHPENFLPST